MGTAGRLIAAWLRNLWGPRPGDRFVFNGFPYILGAVQAVHGEGTPEHIRRFVRPLGRDILEECARRDNPAWKSSGACLNRELRWMTREQWVRAVEAQVVLVEAGNPAVAVWARGSQWALMENPPMETGGAWVLPGCHLLPLPQKRPRDLHPEQFIPQEAELARSVARAMLACDNATVER